VRERYEKIKELRREDKRGGEKKIAYAELYLKIL